MVHELRHQPFRSIYLFFQTLRTYALRIPYWFVASLTRSLRPHPSWSPLKSRVIPYIRLYSEFGPIAARVGPLHSWPDYRAIPDIPGVKSVWLAPTPQLLMGEVKQWANEANVEAISIPGYWIDKESHDTPIDAPAVPGELVILYLHGGGFISESAHPSNFMTSIPRRVLACCPAAKRALSVEYRLCALSPTPTNPFPAALTDAIAGYYHLVSVLRFPPTSIILLGDSAGASLVLSLTRYLVAHAEALKPLLHTDLVLAPPVRAAILLSPWSDLGDSHCTPGSAALTYTFDFLPPLHTGLIHTARLAYAGPLGPTAIEENAYLSPASLRISDADPAISFRGFPPTFIVVGGAERFLDMARTLRRRMVKDMGEEKVGYYEAEDAVHDHVLFQVEEPQNVLMLNALEEWLATI